MTNKYYEVTHSVLTGDQMLDKYGNFLDAMLTSMREADSWGANWALPCSVHEARREDRQLVELTVYFKLCTGGVTTLHHFYRPLSDSLIPELRASLPLPFSTSVITNFLGINGCAVNGMSWTRFGQLVSSITIHFRPEAKDDEDRALTRSEWPQIWEDYQRRKAESVEDQA